MNKALTFALLVGLCIYTYIHTNSIDQDPYLITDLIRKEGGEIRIKLNS